MRQVLKRCESFQYFNHKILDVDGGNSTILDSLNSAVPQAIGKIGSVELQAIRAWLHYRKHADWENETALYRKILYINAGVFPDDPIIFQRYCEYMLEFVIPKITVGRRANYQEVRQ